jgi:hypothetical protein
MPDDPRIKADAFEDSARRSASFINLSEIAKQLHSLPKEERSAIAKLMETDLKSGTKILPKMTFTADGDLLTAEAKPLILTLDPKEDTSSYDDIMRYTFDPNVGAGKSLESYTNRDSIKTHDINNYDPRTQQLLSTIEHFERSNGETIDTTSDYSMSNEPVSMHVVFNDPKKGMAGRRDTRYDERTGDFLSDDYTYTTVAPDSEEALKRHIVAGERIHSELDAVSKKITSYKVLPSGELIDFDVQPYPERNK